MDQFIVIMQDLSMTIDKQCRAAGLPFCGGMAKCAKCFPYWKSMPRSCCDRCKKVDKTLAHNMHITIDRPNSVVHAFPYYYCEFCVYYMNTISKSTGLACQNCYKVVNIQKKVECEKCKSILYCSTKCQKDDEEHHGKICVPFVSQSKDENGTQNPKKKRNRKKKKKKNINQG